MWKRLSLNGELSEANCLERAKRDEDRFTFFLQISKFISDLKKAVVFAHAKREKEQQRRAYQELLSSQACLSLTLTLTLTFLTLIQTLSLFPFP